MKHIFQQQLSLGNLALTRGLIVRNWTILQNVHIGESDPEKKDLQWLAKLIRSVWTYSLTTWLDRCKQIHKKQDPHHDSLNHVELQTMLRKYLNLPRNELSSDEKKLHLKVAKISSLLIPQLWPDGLIYYKENMKQPYVEKEKVDEQSGL